MQDAIAGWSFLSAAGKAAQLSEKHEWLLKTATSAKKTVDVSCQTVDSLLEISHESVQQQIPQPLEEDERQQRWIEQNGVTTGERSMDISSVGLGESASHFCFLTPLNSI